MVEDQVKCTWYRHKDLGSSFKPPTMGEALGAEKQGCRCLALSPLPAPTPQFLSLK